MEKQIIKNMITERHGEVRERRLVERPQLFEQKIHPYVWGVSSM